MPAITGNVSFDNIAREWRCKWSADNEKASLIAAQRTLDDFIGQLQTLKGATVQRIVCGGCLDFKVVTKLPASDFGDWEKAGFAPEASFLEALKAVPGITSVETQTYTLEELAQATEAAANADVTAITANVKFSNIAREWRCKWSADEDKASLTAAQGKLEEVLGQLKGMKSATVQRVVCGGCLDFKVITKLPAPAFGAWEKEGFGPEAAFLEALKGIPGLTNVETQTYTLETCPEPVAITSAVKFNNIAREWRCKWSTDNDKASLTAAQTKLEEVMGQLKAISGAAVQRVVCGGCLDFKVITKLPAPSFGDWEKAGFAPEASFLEALKAVPGITNVETQTYTLEKVAQATEPAAAKGDETAITGNVKFTNIAREWRCKWSAENDKASLTAAQGKLEEVMGNLKALKGASVQRVVCGGCLDFKVVTKLPAPAFGAWEKEGFAPEAPFLEALKAVPGISGVETQTYTLEDMTA